MSHTGQQPEQKTLPFSFEEVWRKSGINVALKVFDYENPPLKSLRAEQLIQLFCYQEKSSARQMILKEIEKTFEAYDCANYIFQLIKKKIQVVFIPKTQYDYGMLFESLLFRFIALMKDKNHLPPWQVPPSTQDVSQVLFWALYENEKRAYELLKNLYPCENLRQEHTLSGPAKDQLKRIRDEMLTEFIRKYIEAWRYKKDAEGSSDNSFELKTLLEALFAGITGNEKDHNSGEADLSGADFLNALKEVLCDACEANIKSWQVLTDEVLQQERFRVMERLNPTRLMIQQHIFKLAIETGNHEAMMDVYNQTDSAPLRSEVVDELHAIITRNKERINRSKQGIR